MIQILSGAGAHASDDHRGLRHLAVGENRDLLGGGADQFNRADGALRILRCDIDDDDFGAGILQLAENLIGRPDGKSDMAENRGSQPRRLQASLQYG